MADMLSVTSCPQNMVSAGMLLLLVLIALALVLIGLASKAKFFGFFGSICLILVSLYLFSCISIYAYVLGLLSVLLLLYFAVT